MIRPDAKPGDRVLWEPLTPGAPKQYGRIVETGPEYVRIDWDVSDGEGNHITTHRRLPDSHVHHVEETTTNV